MILNCIGNMTRKISITDANTDWQQQQQILTQILFKYFKIQVMALILRFNLKKENLKTKLV